jgi:hypothetical protein
MHTLTSHAPGVDSVHVSAAAEQQRHNGFCPRHTCVVQRGGAEL